MLSQVGDFLIGLRNCLDGSQENKDVPPPMRVRGTKFHIPDSSLGFAPVVVGPFPQDDVEDSRYGNGQQDA